MTPHHGVRFARACLPVGKNASVVALEGVVKDVHAETGENLVLVDVSGVVGVQRVETMVERKRLRLFPVECQKNVIILIYLSILEFSILLSPHPSSTT